MSYIQIQEGRVRTVLLSSEARLLGLSGCRQEGQLCSKVAQWGLGGWELEDATIGLSDSSQLQVL